MRDATDLRLPRLRTTENRFRSLFLSRKDSDSGELLNTIAFFGPKRIKISHIKRDRCLFVMVRQPRWSSG